MTTPATRTRGAALIYALILTSLLTLSAVAILAAQTRSSSNVQEVQDRTLARTTAEAAVEHGKAIIKNAIGSQVPLEDIADLHVDAPDLNNHQYEIDLSLAPFGDVRATLENNPSEWAGARLDPLTGEVSRHLTANANIEALTLQGEWRDALVHDPTGSNPILLGIHKDNVFTRAPAAIMPVMVTFPALNAPPSRVTARGSTTDPRSELGLLLDAGGNVWEWPLTSTTPAAPVLTDDGAPLASITTLHTGDRYAAALTRAGDLWIWGSNPDGPLAPGGGASILPTATRAHLPEVEGEAPRLISISAGLHHLLALDADGRIWSWGSNDRQQLGRSCANACAAGLVTLAEVDRIVSVQAGGNRSAALDRSGHLWVWGQTGDVNSFTGTSPQLLTRPNGSPARIAHYSLGSGASLGVDDDGTLLTWTHATATPLPITVTTRDGYHTTLARPDLLRAGAHHHAAILGPVLVTWPANGDPDPEATRQTTPNERPALAHDDLPGLIITPGDTHLALTWDPHEELELSYEITYSRTASDWTPAGVTTSPNYFLANLQNGQPYYLRITGLDPYGDTLLEHVSGPHIPYGPPAAPTNPRITPGNESLDLAWDVPANNGSPITEYRIERSSNGLVWTPLPLAPFEPRAHLTGLENGVTYRHRVTAINAAGQSPHLTMPPGTPQGLPGAPTPEGADGHAQGGTGAITLHWRAPDTGGTNLTQYLVHVSSDGITWEATSASATSTSFTLTNLELSRRYAVRVTAQNALGEGPASSTLTATTSTAPSAPQGLTLSTINANQIMFGWTAPLHGAPLTGYRVERSDGATAPWKHITSVTSPSYTDASVEPGITYRYRVAASNEAGTGAFTPAEHAITGLVPPGQPSAPALLTRTATSLTFTWTAPTDTGGAESLTYRIERGDETMNTWSTLTTGHDDLTFTDATVTPDSTYAYRITAHNGMHQGEPGPDALLATAQALIQPDPPRVIGREHLAIHLEWSAPPGINDLTGFVLERATSDTAFREYAQVPVRSGVQAYSDTQVVAGTRYAYRLRLHTSSGVSDASAATDFILALARSTAPTDLTATPNFEDGTMLLTWSPPSDTGGGSISSYRIQRAGGDEVWTTIAESEASTTFTDTTAPLGHEYAYRVAASNDLGGSLQSPYSAPTPHTFLATAPAKPRAPSVALTAGSATIPTLTWAAPADGGDAITNYALERESSNGWGHLATLPAHTLTFQDDTITAGDTYRYRVTAHNTIGESPASDPSSPYQTHPTLASPAAPTVSVTGNGALTLAWEAPASTPANEIQGYAIARRASDTQAWQLVVPHTGSPLTQHQDVGLTPGTSYEYQLATINQAGATGQYGNPSGPVTVAAPPNAPAAPDVTYTEPTMSLTWLAPHANHASITHYVLERRDSSDGQTWDVWRPRQELPTLSASDTDLTDGRHYQYRVLAVNAAGASSPGTASGSVRVTFTPTTPPGTPQLALQAGSSPTLSWSTPSDGGASILRYDVHTSTDPAFATPYRTYVASGTQTVITVDPPPAGSTLYARVRAVNIEGQGPWSNTISTTREDTPPPGTPTATSVSSSAIALAWASSSASASGYVIERRVSIDGINWGVASSLASSASTTHTDPTVTSGFHYRYRVAPVLAGGGTGTFSAWSATMTASE